MVRLSRIQKNSADQGGCYPQRPKAEVDNTLWDLQNSSYPTNAKFNNCFIIHSKYFPILKGVLPFRSLSSCSPKIAQSHPQVFSVNVLITCSGLHFWHHFDIICSIICSGLHFWHHWFNMAKILSKFGEQQLVMVNYVFGFNQSETGKYFEWIITQNIKLTKISGFESSTCKIDVYYQYVNQLMHNICAMRNDSYTESKANLDNYHEWYTCSLLWSAIEKCVQSFLGIVPTKKLDTINVLSMGE